MDAERRLKELLREGLQLDYQGTFDYDCLRCGSCCKGPGMMLRSDFDRITSAMAMGKAEFYQMFAHFDNGVMRPNVRDGYCTFLDWHGGKSSCRIHEIKPYNCRSGPIAPSGELLAAMSRAGMPSSVEGVSGKPVILMRCPGTASGTTRKVSDWIRQEDMAAYCDEKAGLMLGLAFTIGPEKTVRYLMNKNPLPGDPVFREATNALERIYGIR